MSTNSQSNLPNPFTKTPIPTDMTGNELIMTDQAMRQKSFVGILDNSILSSSGHEAPIYLNLGWKWK